VLGDLAEPAFAAFSASGRSSEPSLLEEGFPGVVLEPEEAFLEEVPSSEAFPHPSEKEEVRQEILSVREAFWVEKDP